MPRRPSIRPVVWQPPPRPPRARGRTGPVPLPPLRLVGVGGLGGIADPGGGPLGLELLPGGRLLVCEGAGGLLGVAPEGGSVEELRGEPMRFCNTAAVAADGTVWFSDTSRRFGIDHWRADILEHSGTGRLLRRDPGGAVEVVLDGLEFANGVALSADEDFVVVAETGAYRLRRAWLRGDPAGTHDVFVENLPGIPDNVSTGPDGLFWVALASPRDPRLDLLHARHPALRRLAWAIPQRLLPERRTGWGQALDRSGAVVHDLQDRHPRYHMVTGVRAHGGRLYLGSLAERAIGILDLTPAGDR